MKRLRTNSVAFLPVALALALPLVACQADFAPFNRLEGLRVLAVQAEPAAPQLGETATLSALVYTPTPDPTLTYQWSWCPLGGSSSDGYKCPFTEEELNGYLMAAPIPLQPLPSFDLGTGETAVLSNSIDPNVFMAVCSGLFTPGLRIDCSEGFPVQITVTVSTATDSVTTVQTMKLRFRPEMTANTNPAVDTLAALVAGVRMPLTELPEVTLPRDLGTRIFATASEAVAETYAGLDDDGAPATLTERLFMTWFVETGGTDDSRTSYRSGTNEFADLLKNIWIPATTKDYPLPTARIYVVLHDNRGGVSWRSGTVNLEPTP